MTQSIPAEPSSAPANQLDSALIRDLESRVRGRVLPPDHEEYNAARTVWNAMIDRRPALIIRCLNTSDVMEGIRFARTHELPLSIRGGGHNIAGLAVCENGLMLDMSLMRGVWVDQHRRVAHAQPGCLLGDIDRETQQYGLAPVLGFVSQTGAAGLTLGGGFGYLTRRFGWTSDNVESMKLVTAEGKIVRANHEDHPNLFWALRGGGGNFGVVTGITYELYDIGPDITGGAIAWRAEEAPEVFDLYREIVRTAPAEFTCVLVIRRAPPAPWLPREVHGELILAMFVCHTGRRSEADHDVSRLRQVGSPVGDILGRRTYVSQQGLLDATQPSGRRYYWKSEYAGQPTDDLLDIALEHGRRIVSPHSAILLFPVDGAIHRRETNHSAVGNRDAGIVLNIAGSWERPEDDEANRNWVRAAWQDMRPFSTGGTYINFQTQDEGTDRIEAAYGENYRRLVEIKTKWDPENFFHVNKNIPPD